MASFNKVILIGNLTRDVEVRYLPSGMAVADIGLAVNDRRKGQNGEWIEEATFVDITLFGRQAEIAGEYLSKGSQTLIEGRLKLDQWEKDGQKRSKLKVIGENMRMLGSKGGGSGRSSGAPPDDAEYGDDDRPPAPSAGRAPAGNAAPRGNSPRSGGGPSGGGDDIPF